MLILQLIGKEGLRHWDYFPFAADKHGHTDVTDLHILLPGKSYHDLLEAKADGAAESYILPLRAYRRMIPGNCTKEDVPKPNALQSAKHIILGSYTDSILPVYGRVILKVAHYMTGKCYIIFFLNSLYIFPASLNTLEMF